MSKGEKRGMLLCLSGESNHEVIKLRQDATIFGREKADIKIADPEVSSTHCQIQNINREYHIFDMNSSNGTHVNSVQVVKAKLQDNDIIRMGNTEFRFTLEDAEKVRHIPTLFKSGNQTIDKSNSLVNSLIDRELRATDKAVIRIQVTYGDGAKEVIDIKNRQVFIGRASSFGKFDQDPEISRKHLLIKLNETGQIFIEDQNSTNGSFINGERINGMHQISDTDEIKVGLCKLKISTPD